MKHEDAKVQRVAAIWHLGFVLLNIGALLYHVVATFEHLKEEKKQWEHKQ